MLTALMINSAVSGRDRHLRSVYDLFTVPETAEQFTDRQEQLRPRWGLDDPQYVTQEQQIAAQVDMGDIDAEWRRINGAG